MPRVFALALALVVGLAAVARADSPVPTYPRNEPHVAISNGLEPRELDDLVKWMRRKLLRADADYHVLLVEFTHQAISTSVTSRRRSRTRRRCSGSGRSPCARLLLSQAHDRKKATLAKARELAPDGGSAELRAAVATLEQTDGDPELVRRKSEELEALLRPLVVARDARDRADMTARVQVLADEVARLEKARTELARTAPRSLGPDVDRLGRMLEQSARSLRSIEREDAAVRETSFAASKNQIAIHARELAALEERVAAHVARLAARVGDHRARRTAPRGRGGALGD